MENTKHKNIMVSGGVIILMILSFFGGVQYEKNGMKNSTPENKLGQFGGMNRTVSGGNRMGGPRSMGGGNAFGEIISKDDKSITIKLVDGGSKIIFLGESTKVLKSVDGSITDLAVGTPVTIMGTPNADGSTTAQSIQIRQALPKNIAK